VYLLRSDDHARRGLLVLRPADYRQSSALGAFGFEQLEDSAFLAVFFMASLERYCLSGGDAGHEARACWMTRALLVRIGRAGPALGPGQGRESRRKA